VLAEDAEIDRFGGGDAWSCGTGSVRAFIDFVREDRTPLPNYHENWKTIGTHEQKTTAIPASLAILEMTVRIYTTMS
jgi:hypothetical protein